jgi:ATP-dependent RNA helicase DeaD
MTQAQRDRVMKRFRENSVEILVATDVAARGLDVENVSHVINYDLPDDPDQYVHRIGRTGRAGRKGVAISFVTPRERRLFGVIERIVGKRIKPMRLPTAADIQARRLDLLKAQVRESIQAGALDGYLALVADLQEEFDPAEIAAGFAKIAADATQPRSLVGATDVAAESTRPEAGMARIVVAAGRRDGIRPADLVGAIANETGLPGRAIGAIDIYPDHAFVEVPADRRDEIVRLLSKTTIKGSRVRIDAAPPRGPDEEERKRTRRREDARPASANGRRSSPSPKRAERPERHPARRASSPKRRDSRPLPPWLERG